VFTLRDASHSDANCYANRYADQNLIIHVRTAARQVNAETNKLVVSNRRAVLEQEMKELSRGDVVEGYVKAIKPYGAFVEIRYTMLLCTSNFIHHYVYMLDRDACTACTVLDCAG
jgi:polyribonucleotide nucleotidyltransferase